MNRLSGILNDALKRLDEGAGLQARAVMLWPEIVGPQLARAGEVRGLQNGTLVIATRSSAWSLEFSFLRQTILRRYRERLGRDVVRDLRFTVQEGSQATGPGRGGARWAPPDEEVRRLRLSPDEERRIDAAAAGADPEIAAALRRALTHEAQLRRWHLDHGARACSGCGAIHRSPHERCPACRREAAG